MRLVNLKLFTSILLTFLVIGLLTFQALNYQQPREERIEDLVKDVISEVKAIRELEFREEPEVKVVEKSWVLEQWGPTTYSEEIAFWEDIYKLTLLVDENYNYTRTVESYTASWIAAASGDTIYIVKENFLINEDTSLRVIAHELVHVLQYQNFNIPPANRLDEELALSALIEGDADLVADRFSKSRGITISRITVIPIYDPPLALKYFPYVYGIKFVKYLYAIGGWTLVNKAYTSTPNSTEQVMHPRKFLEGENPIGVAITVPENYKLVHSDVLGEFYIYVLIASRVNETVASRVAEGWGGDRVVLLENNTHKVLIWKIRWDTTQDCQEFYSAYCRILENLGWEEKFSERGVRIYVLDNRTITIKVQESTLEIVSTIKV